MSPSTPQLQRFSDEMESIEILQYMVILYRVVKDQDVNELNRYLKYVSKVISPEDFNNLVRRVVRMMGTDKCGDSLCSDWLMTSLYELYSAYGTESTSM